MGAQLLSPSLPKQLLEVSEEEQQKMHLELQRALEDLPRSLRVKAGNGYRLGILRDRVKNLKNLEVLLYWGQIVDAVTVFQMIEGLLRDQECTPEELAFHLRQQLVSLFSTLIEAPQKTLVA